MAKHEVINLQKCDFSRKMRFAAELHVRRGVDQLERSEICSYILSKAVLTVGASLK